MTNSIIIQTIKFWLLIAILSFSVMACEGDDTPEPDDETPDNTDTTSTEEPQVEELDSTDFQVRTVEVFDISENGNASDIQINFRSARLADSVATYKVVISSEDETISGVYSKLSSVSDDQVLSITEEESKYSVTLNEGQLDLESQAVTNEKSYVLWVITEGSFNGDEIQIVTGPSQVVELLERPTVTTLVDGIDSNDQVAIDAEGNIYTTEFGQWTSGGGLGTKLLKVTPDGTVSEFATDLSGPLGTIVGPDGDIYLIDGNNGSSGKLVKITTAGEKTEIAEIEGWPASMAIDDEGNAYVSNYYLNRVNKVTPSGEVTVFAENDGLTGCVGIVWDDSGNLLLGNYNDGNLFSINMAGEVSHIATIDGVVANFGVGYIAYFENHIYATGIGNHVIYKVNLDNGDAMVYAGSGAQVQKDGPAHLASFVNPNGIAIDSVGRVLYVQDWGQQALRKITILD